MGGWGWKKGEQTSLPQQGRGKTQREEEKKLTFSELLLGLRPFFLVISHIVHSAGSYG